MSKQDRIEKILSIIQSSNRAIPARELANQLNVSRQVIVQDIALLRAQNVDIVSTNKGYIIQSNRIFREINVNHDISCMEEELNKIVDLGAKVESVFVYHDIYGKLEAKLDIASRRDVSRFMEMIKTKEVVPLTNLTHGHHGHVISACNHEILDEIVLELEKIHILEKES